MSAEKESSAERKSPQEKLVQVLRYGSPGEKMLLAYELDSDQVESDRCNQKSLSELRAEAERGWQQVAKTLAANSVDSYRGSQEAAALRILAHEGRFDPAQAGVSDKEMNPHRIYRPLEAY